MVLQRFNRELGEDLRVLIEGLGVPLVAAEVVTRLPSPTRDRASFRLQLADGQVLKGRRFQTERSAEKVERLSQFLDSRYFPRVLARRGSGMLQEWVSGHPVTVATCDQELAHQCGAVQAALHCTPLPDEARSRRGDGSVRTRQADLERNMRALFALGVLSRREESRLLDFVISHAPERAAVGLIHGDFCGENMVVRAPRHVSIVDSETVAIDAIDYDLGRTWYRWPMTRPQREAYDEGYRRCRPSADFAEHFFYWATLVLVEAALFRIRAGTQDAWVPVGQLRALLRKPEQADSSSIVPIPS